MKQVSFSIFQEHFQLQSKGCSPVVQVLCQVALKNIDFKLIIWRTDSAKKDKKYSWQKKNIDKSDENKTAVNWMWPRLICSKCTSYEAVLSVKIKCIQS